VSEISPTAAVADGAWRHILLASPAFVVLIGLAGLLWHQPWMLFSILSLACLFLLWKWWGPRSLGFFLVALVLGPSAEYFAVLRGAWSYADHDLLPIWLPSAWGLAGLFLGRISDALERIFSLGLLFPSD